MVYSSSMAKESSSRVGFKHKNEKENHIGKSEREWKKDSPPKLCVSLLGLKEKAYFSRNSRDVLRQSLLFFLFSTKKKILSFLCWGFDDFRRIVEARRECRGVGGSGYGCWEWGCWSFFFCFFLLLTSFLSFSFSFSLIASMMASAPPMEPPPLQQENQFVVQTLEGDQLKETLTSLVDYFLSRSYLEGDPYMVSQMNADRFLPVNVCVLILLFPFSFLSYLFSLLFLLFFFSFPFIFFLSLAPSPSSPFPHNS